MVKEIDTVLEYDHVYIYNTTTTTTRWGLGFACLILGTASMLYNV